MNQESFDQMSNSHFWNLVLYMDYSSEKMICVILVHFDVEAVSWRQNLFSICEFAASALISQWLAVCFLVSAIQKDTTGL